MAVTAIIGTGASITFSGFTYKLLDIKHDGIERAMIQASKMDTTTAHEFLAATLRDCGTLTVEIEWNGTLPTMATTAATLTVTFSNASSYAGSAYIQSVSINNPLEDKATATVTFKYTGNVA